MKSLETVANAMLYHARNSNLTLRAIDAVMETANVLEDNLHQKYRTLKQTIVKTVSTKVKMIPVHANSSTGWTMTQLITITNV